MVKQIIITMLAFSLINVPVAYAKGKGSGGKSSKSSTSTSKSSRSYSSSRGSYGGYSGYSGYSSHSSTTSSNTSTTSSNHSEPITTTSSRPVYTFRPILKATTTNKRAGLRTCANQHCTVVSYLSKGTKVELIEEKDGFFLLKNEIHWISGKDIK